MNRSPLFLATAAASGVLFGFGLAIAGMTNPTKVRDFLDITAIAGGGWDPSLAFVMGAGVAIGLIGLRLDRYLRAPVAASAFIRTNKIKIDRRLVAGSAIFGIGWGLSGLCPGPAIADLALVPQSVSIFVLAMLAASWSTGIVLNRQDTTIAAAAPHSAPG
ncbi:MAG: DUF6691 family protein [Alphaproteobacteria bacterium]